MIERKEIMIRPISLPNCPVCNCKNTVGQVDTFIEKTSRAGSKYHCCSKAFFCSNCLTEWDDENVKAPLYA